MFLVSLIYFDNCVLFNLCHNIKYITNPIFSSHETENYDISDFVGMFLDVSISIYTL